MSTKKSVVMNSNGQFEQLQTGDVINDPAYNSQNSDNTKTGNLLETVLCNLKVNGGDMGANGKAIFEGALVKIGTGGIVTWKMYLSTVSTNTIGNTGVPTSSTQIALITQTATNLNGGTFNRQLVNKNNQALNTVAYPLASSNSQFGPAAATRLSPNINTANDYYLIITATLGSAADSAILDNVEIVIRTKS